MNIRLIAGRAGSGKTHRCLTEVCQALAESRADGPRLILLVPEQAALQMERGILEMLAAAAPSEPTPPGVGANRSPVDQTVRHPSEPTPPGVGADNKERPDKVVTLGRCEVLSFRRLARKILQSADASGPVVMTTVGRQMALRFLIGRDRSALREFGRVSDHGGFVAGLGRTIIELLQESVSVDQLEQASTAAEAAGDASAPRMHDIAFLYKAYLEYLGSERVDPEGVLDLARARLANARTSSASPADWLDGAEIWMDGFAGLTQQQMRMVIELATRASRFNVSFLLDPAFARQRPGRMALDELSLFARTERTWAALSAALQQAGATIEPPIILGETDRPRFRQAAALSRLEQALFNPMSPSRASIPMPTLTAEPSPLRPLRLVRAANPRVEVGAAAKAALDLTLLADRPLRFRDIAFIVRDLEPYHDLLSGSLRAHGIPFFIDRRRTTYHHPLVEFVRSVMATHGPEPFVSAVSRMLKTGLVGLSDCAADALENHALAHGLTSAAEWESEWTHPPPGLSTKADPFECQAALAPILDARRLVREALGEWWPGTGAAAANGRRWVDRLYDVLERCDVRGRLAAWCEEAGGDLGEISEHEQVWRDLVELLDETVAVLGDERMSARRFRDILESALSEFTLGLVPPTLDQVLVGSIERSRHPPVRAVFLIGFGEGQFPTRMGEEALLGDDERACLERVGAAGGRGRAQRLLDERMLAYIAMTRPSEHLWISHPQADAAGRALAPSPYWDSVRAVLPDVVVEDAPIGGTAAIGTTADLASELGAGLRAWADRREASSDIDRPFLQLYEWARGEKAVREKIAQALGALRPIEPAVLSAASIAALWQSPHRISVTHLEQFAQCPFQHFVASGLNLQQRPQNEMGALEMGSLYHTILEQFVNELSETGRRLPDLSADEIARNLLRLGDAVLPRQAERTRMSDPQRRRARRRIRADLPPAVAGQQALIGGIGLKSVCWERSFGGGPDQWPAVHITTEDGRAVSITGKIDRVDLMQTDAGPAAIVFDYKRSIGRRLKLDEAYHGLALQLLVYLLVLADHGEKLGEAAVTPAGAFYLSLLGKFRRVSHPSEGENESAMYHDFRPRGVLDFDWAGALEPGIAEGGWGSAFSVYRTKDGAVGHLDRSDAVERGQLPALLAHVRQTIVELTTRWLSGDISIQPSRLGDDVPCVHCTYQSVCRMEYATRQTRRLEPMKRTEVLTRIAGKGGGDG